MYIFRLFRRSQSPATARFEPLGIQLGNAFVRADSDSPQAEDDTPLTFARDQDDEDLRGSHAIFGLIGSRMATEATGTRPVPEGASGDPGDLIATLHTQYCQALDNPWVPIGTADWVPASAGAGAVGLPVDLHVPAAGNDSIEALLSGAQLLDHAFGPLRESDLGSLPESEPVPEILRLFAPPEYLASTRRQAPALPPTLARREHHSFGIDSPLPMPEARLTEGTT
jgi:hypothetical protein